MFKCNAYRFINLKSCLHGQVTYGSHNHYDSEQVTEHVRDNSMINVFLTVNYNQINTSQKFLDTDQPTNKEINQPTDRHHDTYKPASNFVYIGVNM